MKCPVCGCKDWVLEQDPLSECGHGWDDIVKEIERLKKELDVVCRLCVKILKDVPKDKIDEPYNILKKFGFKLEGKQ